MPPRSSPFASGASALPTSVVGLFLLMCAASARAFPVRPSSSSAAAFLADAVVAARRLRPTAPCQPRGVVGVEPSNDLSSFRTAAALFVSLSPSAGGTSAGIEEDGGGVGSASASASASAVSARAVALRSLSSSRDYSLRNLEADPSYTALSDPRDRAFARNLVATTERRMGQLDEVLGRCADRYPPKGARKQNNGKGGGGGCSPSHGDLVRAALRMGAAQLLFLSEKTPPYAAVKETVEALRSEGKIHLERGRRALPESSIKFVNAILRRVQREGEGMLEQYTSPQDNVAEWLVREWTESWGEDATRKICQQMMNEPRINLTPRCLFFSSIEEKRTAKLEGLRDALGEGAVILPQGSIRAGKMGWAGGAVSSWPGYDEGEWWVQDVSSTIPALALRSALLTMAKDSSGNNAAATLASSSEGGVLDATDVDYSAYKVAELKDMCRERNLPVSGTKPALMERLTSHSFSSSSSSSSPGHDAAASLHFPTNNSQDDNDNADGDGEASILSTMHVVDMCAAPGGKTSQLLSMGFGRVTAVEANARRCRRLRENLDRLGFALSGEGNDNVNDGDAAAGQCEIVVSKGQEWLPPPSPGAEGFGGRGVGGAAAAPTESSKVRGVLLDVPCSATGTGSRRPDVLRRSSDLGDLPKTQWSLATHVADRVLDVGGVVVYATCSLLKREGEDVVERLLLRRGNGSDQEDDEQAASGAPAEMEMLPFHPGEIPGFDDAICPEKGWMRVLPGTLGGEMDECDGFFVARLIKRR